MNKKETFYAIEDIGGFPDTLFPDVDGIEIDSTVELLPNYETR